MAEVDSLRPMAAVLVSAVGVAAILAAHRRPNVREAATMVVAVGKFGLVASMVPGVLDGTTYVTDFGAFVPGVRFALRADPLGTLFALLASFLWILTSLYSVGYMRGLDEHAQTRYFAAFAASLSAAVGVAFAENLVVLFVFYELLTVATYPLVTHDETAEARAAGRKYLAYTFGGGVAVLAGAVLVFQLTGTASFAPGGIEALASADPAFARATFAVLVAGFGVKAALMPLHSWLPDAMVAPTPVSGLLHAVAVVKSGVFGIARVVLEVYGPETVADLGVGLPLAAVAAFTILAASVVALRQDNLKRRLAYSTVSQLSYIVLGLGVLAPEALVGGLLHIPAHAFMKLTLFFCAGAIHVETHTDDISDMAGIGKRMPLTMAAFGVASVGMAGIPLLAGFVSKWYLLVGSVAAGEAVFAAALLLSGVLNVAYFWPVVYQAFFESEDAHDAKPLVENPLGGRTVAVRPDGGEEPDQDGGEELDPDEGEELDPDEGEELDPDGGEELDPDEDAASPQADPGAGRSAVDRAETGSVAAEHGGSTTTDEDASAGDADGQTTHGDEVTPGFEAGYADDPHARRGGPPADGWERRGVGDESTWFVLGPTVATATGAVVLGIVPHAAVFLRLVEVVVRTAGVVA